MAPRAPAPAAAGDYSHTPGLNRRQLAIGAVSLVVLGAGLLRLQAGGATAQPMPATVADAPPETAAFLAFSKAITGHAELDPITAGRLCAAMLKASGDFAGQLQKLAEFAGSETDPKAVLARADAAGLRGTALSVVAAWYTGTVGTGAGATMVAYAKALMYRPVMDGMPVPTYCNFGPVWWTVAPPAVRVSVPVEPKPVVAAPTTGTPVSTANPPAAPKTTPAATR
jgi:hypothetical protein